MSTRPSQPAVPYLLTTARFFAQSESEAVNAGRPFGEWWEEMTASTAGLAGELGFEPRQTESESVVLPLHHSPMNCSVFNTLRNSVRQSLAIGVLQNTAKRSVFYSLAPGLGKHSETAFLRNHCRQLRGDEGSFQRSVREFARTAEFQLRCGVMDADAPARSNVHCQRSQFRLLPSTTRRHHNARDTVCLSRMQSKPASSPGTIVSPDRNRAMSRPQLAPANRACNAE